MRAAVLTLIAICFLAPGQGRAEGAPIDARNDRLQRQHGQYFFDGTAFAGEMATHRADGSLKSLIAYQNGKRHGEARGWWPNGQLRYLRNYEYGLAEGDALEWYDSGQLRYRQKFTNGHENGLQQGWHEDGSPAFVYAYMDGRRYGVLGSKPCYSTNPEAEVYFNENL